MRSERRLAWVLVALAPLSIVAACQNAEDDVHPYARHGASGGRGATTQVVDPGPLRRFQPPPDDPGPESVLVTASGEVLALGGYAFPPRSANDVAFVDGWQVTFDRVLTTIDHVALSSNPDRSPGDPSLTEAVVAQVDGPWAIDLHAGGVRSGKGGGGEQAVPIAALTGAFDPTQRYAFSYDVVPATLAAQNVNLVGESLADYEAMISGGCTVLYVGTATFVGGACTPASDPVLDALPKQVHFRYCFVSPTSYLNCQNPDNDPAQPFEGEEHQRGVAIKPNTFSVAQITLHTDHPFWESTVHDVPAHFDPMAARARVADGGAATVTLDDLTGVDFRAFTDRSGRVLPRRTCVATYTPAAGALGYDARSVPRVAPSGDPAIGLRDFRDFVTYDQSTQGHLNADGLCFVRRHYPSPP